MRPGGAVPGIHVLTPADADAAIARQLTCLPIESLPLVQCAGAVLRENIYAERDQPPFDRVAMDGIALRVSPAAHRALRVEATQAAGDPPHTLGSPECCIEVMTGAMLPAGCDCVVPVEQISVAGGFATVAAEVQLRPGLNIHRRASDTAQGTLLLAAGIRLGAPEIAIGAGAGMARIRVSSEPRLAVISTGNELIEPGEPILPHQVRRSNAYGIVAALRLHGFRHVADDHLPDDPGEMRERLRFHLDTHDVLVLSGGVSAGRFDLVPAVLAELGVQVVFHKVAQRPGKPLWFGVARTGAAVFALPGNPVSTAICLARYVIPALFASQGLTAPDGERVALGAPVAVRSALAFFQPVRLETDEWGRTWALPRQPNGSGDFMALGGTDGFVELPPGPQEFARGFIARLHRW